MFFTICWWRIRKYEYTSHLPRNVCTISWLYVCICINLCLKFLNLINQLPKNQKKVPTPNFAGRMVWVDRSQPPDTISDIQQQSHLQLSRREKNDRQSRARGKWKENNILKTGCSGYMRIILHSYMGSLMKHYKDPH